MAHGDYHIHMYTCARAYTYTYGIKCILIYIRYIYHENTPSIDNCVTRNIHDESYDFTFYRYLKDTCRRWARESVGDKYSFCICETEYSLRLLTLFKRKEKKKRGEREREEAI